MGHDTAPQPYVQATGLGYRYGSEVQLAYPDLALQAGEQLAITGPSGSGKTTLLHLLAGLLRPSSGELWVGGKQISALGELGREAYRREGVGYLFQDFHLMPGLSAQENVELGLRVAGADPAQAAAALKALGLGHRLKHRPEQLSTGERQRVALARAVAHRPRLLLADEPTAHLDRSRAHEVVELLAASARDLGATLLVVTHDPLVSAAFPGLEIAPTHLGGAA